MSVKEKVPRKSLLIVNRDFQFRYAGAAVIVGVMSTILTGVVILYPLYRFEILRIPQFLPLPILSVMLFAGVMNVLLVGLMAIFLTHRIAGPIYAIVRHIREVESGKLDATMKIRDGDELGYLVRNFNAMVESLQKSVQQELNQVAEIQAEMTHIPEISSNKNLLESIGQMRLQLENRLGKRNLDSLKKADDD